MKCISGLKGFTLIELMIVVAIVGILASIANAYYGDSVVASKRTEARAAMTQTSASLEKCKVLYGVYNNNCNVVLPFTTETGIYSIAATVLTASAFTLTATPQGSQLRDTDCTLHSLTNTGDKSGSTGNDPGECW